MPSLRTRRSHLAKPGVAIQENRLRVDELRRAGHNPAKPLDEDGLDRRVWLRFARHLRDDRPC